MSKRKPETFRCGKCVACRMGCDRGGLLCEYGTPERFERHRASRAGLNMEDWAVATMDEGIYFVAGTRRKCLSRSGIATRYTRKVVGWQKDIYNYVSEEGTSVYIGSIAALIDEGFVVGASLMR